MLRLILDRSCALTSFALAAGDQILCKMQWGGSMRSPGWFAEMAESIQGAGRSVAEVDEFICVTGPGSFSGIRSALAALEGMALPGQKPLYGISSAAVLAAEYFRGDADLVSVIGDARRSRLWCVNFKLDQSGIKIDAGKDITNTASDFRLIKPQELAGEVSAGALVISPDWDRIEDQLTATFPADRLIKKNVSPGVEIIVALLAKFPSVCTLEPLPVYLHPAVAAKKLCSSSVFMERL